MKSRSITVIFLLAAVVFYALGYAGWGWSAFAIGAVFELWFWVRLIS